MNTLTRFLTLPLLASLALPVTSPGQQTDWISPVPSSWFVDGNWTNGVPDANTYGGIGNGGTAFIVGSPAFSNSLSVGNSLGDGYLLIDNGGSLTSNSPDSIGPTIGGSGSTGVVQVRNGTWTEGGILDLGSYGGHGTLTISNNATVSLFWIEAGFEGGTGVINIGEGGAAGILDVGNIDGLFNTGPTNINFNHNEANYYFTRDGTATGAAPRITGTFSVNQIGSGKTTLMGTNTYTGGTTISGGTLSVSADENMGRDIGTLSLDHGATWEITESFTTMRATTQISGVSVWNIAADKTLTHNGVISSLDSTGNFSKVGAGTLVLGGDNTYQGGTGLFEGTLVLNHDSALGSGGLSIDGSNAVVQYGDGVTIGSNLILSEDATLHMAGTDSATQSGLIFALGVDDGITKTGTGTLALTNGDNTYSGGTTIDGGTLVIGANGATGNGTITVLGSTIQYAHGVTETNPIDLQNDVTLEVLGIDSAVQSGAIGETGDSYSVTKTGTGTLRLEKAGNTYSGGTHLSEGTLIVGNTGALGSGTLTISDGTTLGYRDTASIILENDVIIDGDFSVDRFASGRSLLIEGNFSLGAETRTITSTSDSNLILRGTISGSGGLTVNATGISLHSIAMDGSDDNTYTGTTTVNNFGRLVLRKDPGAIAIQGDLDIHAGGTVILYQADNQIKNDVTVTVNGLLISNDSDQTIGELLGSGQLEGNQNTDHTITILSGNFSGAISDRGIADTRIVKSGSGTLTLTGENTYHGGTVIEEGTLLVNNTTGSGTGGTGAVEVQSGGTLGGNGFIGGEVTVLDGGTLAPGTSPGTLTINNNLILNNASLLDYELDTPGVVGGGVNDLIQVNGDLTLDGIMNITDLGGFGDGTYRLFNYTGSLTDNGLLFDSAPGGYDLTVDTATGGEINLNVAFSGMQYWDDSQTTANGTIEGGTGTWNAATTNWTNAGGNANSAWADGLTAVFTTTGGTVTIADGFTAEVGGIDIQADGYAINDTGLGGTGEIEITGDTNVNVGDGFGGSINADITGTGTLVKTGGGTLTLFSGNNYSGGISINEGTIIASGGNSVFGSGDITMDGGTLQADFSVQRNVMLNDGGGTFHVLAGETMQTIDRIISGTGSLTKTGDGTLNHFSTGTWTGGTIVEGGLFSMREPDSAPQNTDYIINGGMLRLSHALTMSSLSGTGGTLNALAFAPVTVDQDTDTTFAGTVDVQRAIIKSGTGELVLSGQVTSSGSVTVEGGRLVLSNSANDYSRGTTLDPGGTLVIANNNVLGSGDLTINGGTIEGTDAWRITNTMVVNGDFSVAPLNTLPSIDALELDGNMILGDTTRTITNTLDFFSFEFGQVNFGGVISGDAGVGLTLQDNGALPGFGAVFFAFDGSGANTYDGLTTLGSNVSLQLAKDANVTAIAGDLTVNSEAVAVIVNDEQIADTATVTLNGNGQLQVGLGGAVTETFDTIADDGSGNGIIDLDDDGSTIAINQGTFHGTITGGAADTVSLAKEGTGTLTLRGASDFLGNSTLNGGTLRLENDLALSGGTLTVLGSTVSYGNGQNIANPMVLMANVDLEVLGTDIATQSGDISGAGFGVTKIGDGQLKLTGTSTYTGDTVVNAGELRVTQGGSVDGTFQTIIDATPGDFARLNITGNGGGASFTGTDALLVGDTNRGILRVANGGTASFDSITAGDDAGSNGRINVDGAGSVLTSMSANPLFGFLVVGESGRGIMNVTNGGVVNAEEVTFGLNAGSSARVVVDGDGSQLNGDGVIIGSLGDAEAQVSNGGVINGTYLGVGFQDGSDSSLVIDGADSLVDINGNAAIGNDGMGTLWIQNGGTLNSTIFTTIGGGATGTGIATVTGANSNWDASTSYFAVGNNGDGTLNILDGGQVQASYGDIGTWAGSMGVVNVDGAGSSFEMVDFGLYLGFEGTGTLNLSNGGTLNQDTGAPVALGVNGSGTGILNIGTDPASANPLMAPGIVNAPGITTLDGTGTLNFNHTGADYFFTNDGTDAGTGVVISGPTTVNHLAGMTTLTAASTYTGPTNVTGGGLKTTDADALGSGDLNVNTAGTFMPTGPVNVGGNFALGDGGILSINVDDGGRINAAGTADIADGNLAAAGAVARGDEFVLIDSAGLSGDLAAFIIPAGSILDQTATQLLLIGGSDASPIQRAANTPNERTVAGMLAPLFTSPDVSPDMNEVLVAFENLAALGDTNGIRLGLNQIAPEELATIKRMVFAYSNTSFRNLQRRGAELRAGFRGASLDGLTFHDRNGQMRPGAPVVAGTESVSLLGLDPKMMEAAPDNRWGFFAKGTGQFGDVDGDEDLPGGYDFTTGGVTLGVDYRLARNFVLGTALGYAGSEADTDTLGSTVDVDAARFGLYATWFDPAFELSGQGWYVDAYAGGAYNSYTTERAITFGGLNRTADGDTDGLQFDTSLTGGYDFNLGGGFTVSPYAGAQYTNVAINSYTETGARALNLAVNDTSAESLRSNLGVVLAWRGEAGGITWRPEIRAAWQHEFLDGIETVDSRFASGAGTLFNTRLGEDIADDSAFVGASLNADFAPGASAFLSYDAEANPDYLVHSINGGFSFSF